MELLWPNKTAMNTFLEIDFEFVNKCDRLIEREHYPRAPWEVEVSPFKSRPITVKPGSGSGPIISNDLPTIKKLMRWEKFAQFPSELPNQLVYKFESQD